MSESERSGERQRRDGYSRSVGDLMTWANAAKAMAGAVVAVSVAVAAVTQGCDPPSTGDCFDVETEHPGDTIPFSQWAATEFRLSGSNSCGRELTVHVAFFALSESFRFQPPAGCPTENPMMDDPECWAVQTLNEGDVDWSFFPPALHPLGNPPVSGGDRAEGTVLINMRWVVYADQAHIVDARTEQMSILDDRLPG